MAQGLRPSGKAWEAYKKKELAYTKKHGKSSGNYFIFNGQRWRLDNKGRGQYYAKSVDVKNEENKKVDTSRDLMISNQTASDVDQSRTAAKTARINLKGDEAHHINPLYRVEKGLIAKYGYIPDDKREEFAKQGMFFGDDPRNIMGAAPPKHKGIHSEDAAMDNALKKQTNKPAPTVLDLVNNPQKKFAIYEVGGGVTTKLIPKAAKSAAKFVPVAGSGMVFAEFGQRAATAAVKPTALNLLQATISGLESAAEGVSLASYGSGVAAPVGAIADGVSMSLGLVNGAIDSVKDLSGVTPSTPSKRRTRRLP